MNLFHKILLLIPFVKKLNESVLFERNYSKQLNESNIQQTLQRLYNKSGIEERDNKIIKINNPRLDKLCNDMIIQLEIEKNKVCLLKNKLKKQRKYPRKKKA